MEGGDVAQDSPLESRMMRYRYGPWDPSYFAVLGSLVGRGLIEVVPAESTNALGYRTTEAGAALGDCEPPWKSRRVLN